MNDEQGEEAHDEKVSFGMGSVGWVVLGAALVLVGVAVLLGQALDVDVGEFAWPFFVIIPGAVLLAAGVGSRRRSTMVAGSVVTTTGLLLLYQNSTGHFESWAYAWALVSMVAPGMGNALSGRLTARPDLVANGNRQAVIGLGFFAVGLVFFELVIGIRGDPGPLRDVGVPLLLIALGLWALVGGYLTRRR